MPPYKDKDDGVVLSFNGRLVSYSHTFMAYAAFASALVVGVSLHYQKIVQNEWFGYPEEWFPSVSATIGDRYPERSFFMLFIALTSGPRFALVCLMYLINRKNGPTLAKIVAFMGMFRTLTCGGWTYVTSTDDHDWHDIFMISYLVATLPWTLGCIALTKAGSPALKYRKLTAGCFFGALFPMVYFFIQHKVHRIPGAYTTYAFFEWSLVLSDVAFDAVTAIDFAEFDIIIKENKGDSPGKEKAAIGFLSPQFSWVGLVDLMFDVYHGFIFWSILTSLGLLVWYFPLWYMGISGYEALVMTSLSPLFLVIKPFRSLVVNYQGMFHLLSLVGVAAYLVPKPTERLFTVGAGVFFSVLAWTGSFVAEASHSARLEGKIVAFLLGLALSSTAKYAWLTNNPIWPTMHEANGGLNGIGLAVGVLAVLRFVRRPVMTSAGVAPVIKAGWFSSWLSAASVGGIMFALHSLLSDSSTMILWVWEGFPYRGPESSVHGYLTLATMTVGALTGMYKPGLLSSWTMYGIGCLGAGVLTTCSHWKGYGGALTLAFYLPGVAVPILATAAKKTPAMVFGLGFLIYNFMVLFHVWVVAYAFVPGGPLVREHTDWIMTCMMVQIGCGVFDLNVFGKQPEKKQSETKRQQQPLAAATTAQRKSLSLVAVAINVLFLVAAFFRFPSNDYTPYHADAKVLTAGIWTIHFSLDNDMWSSEKRMAALLREMEVDVVGLLESDEQRIIMGNRDSTQQLAHELGMYVDYGPGPNKHTWGAALLSKFPIINSTHHLLPSPVGELAPAIHATLDVYGELVDVFVFHSGQEEDPEDRRLQSEYLAKLMGSTPRPAFLLSYLVTRPLEGNYNTYVSNVSGMHDVDPSDWDRWCEYILYKGLRRVGYARVSRSTITDTELQTAKFVLARDADERALLEAVGDEVRNQRVNEEDVPEGWRYPALFRGEGVRGHRYHVFDEPRYYGF
ncbi:hypothetical protein TD95_000749 [Thielaviopsis punctulata]|uniref:Calcofluor white hypersensitive protein n=1 Tax=Thielaviopsis punctulata TaxID=72032 RepID=A0A0F4ZKW1_9PEZI|nr:hypothetical protein TD95_000749 [Thielaviopsis punctulata]